MSLLRKGSFAYKGSHLHADGVDLVTLADQFQTPCHVYSRYAILPPNKPSLNQFSNLDTNRKQLEDNIKGYRQALGRLNHRIGFAIKVLGINYFVIEIQMLHKF